MKVFRKYTLKTLLSNKVRTIVTIIGITLSVSLLTAVLCGFMSARQYAIDRVIKSTGSFDMFVESKDAKKLHEAAEDFKVKESAYLYDIGFSYIDSKNAYKPYLYVGAMSDNFTDMVSVNVTEGRLPESSDEIMLPMHLYENGKVEYKLGDTVNVNTGKRVYEGDTVWRNDEFAENEELADTTSHSYTVVGFYERFSYTLESYSSPGYTALTLCDESVMKENTGTAFLKMKKQRDTLDYEQSLIDDTDLYPQKNVRLLSYSGISSDDDTMAVLSVFMATLIFIIMFGSVALIYNSFSISISERTRQFGILKSVGATKKQILGTVMYEVVYLCIVSIPAGFAVGCTGMGITLYGIKDIFDTALNDTVKGVYLSLHVRPWMFVTVMILGLITTFISALIPAARAMRIMPVDSIRGRYDIKLKAKKLKTSKLAYKMFGFPGMIAKKNFKRSKKKYRSTVLSLCVSVVLFVSTSSFSSYMINAVDVMANNSDYDVRAAIYMEDDEDKQVQNEEYYGLYDRLKKINGVKTVFRGTTMYSDISVTEEMVTEKYRKMYLDREYQNTEDNNEIPIKLCFVDKAEYDRLVSDNDISIPDEEKPYGLLLNTDDTRWEDADGKVWKEGSDVFVIKDYPCTMTSLTHIYDEAEGEEDEEDNERIEYSDIYIAGEIKDKDRESYDAPCIIYPYDVIDNMRKGNGSSEVLEYFFKTDEHKYVTSEVTDILGAVGAEQMFTGTVQDIRQEEEENRALELLVSIFAYGFIILISLIAMANVFNTISTNIMIRRGEIAMLKSVGMSDKQLHKMMYYECLLYGIKGLAYGMGIAVIITYFLYRQLRAEIDIGFYIPVRSIFISVLSVFAVVFATMLYSVNKIKKDNTVETLKNENI